MAEERCKFRSFALPRGTEITLHLRIADPDTEFLQAWELMLNFLEGRRSLTLRQILEQFRCRGGIFAARAGADDAPHELTIQEEIIGAGCELDQAVGHGELLPEAG
jgi:hypothetical protein